MIISNLLTHFDDLFGFLHFLIHFFPVTISRTSDDSYNPETRSSQKLFSQSIKDQLVCVVQSTRSQSERHTTSTPTLKPTNLVPRMRWTPKLNDLPSTNVDTVLAPHQNVNNQSKDVVITTINF